MTFRLYYLPPMNTSHTRRHWSVHHRERKQMEWLVLAALPKGSRRKLEKAHLTLTRYSAKQPDFENLAQSFKGIVDSLVSLGVIVDDDPQHLTRTYLWEKSPPKQGYVTVTVTVEEI